MGLIGGRGGGAVLLMDIDKDRSLCNLTFS